MKKRMILMSLMFATFPTQLTVAADRTSWATTTSAVRTANQVTVSIRITKTTPDGKTAVLSAPRMTILLGRRGEMAIGNKDANSTKEIESGVRVEVISVRDKDEVLVVTTIIEKGEIVWADASKTKVVQKAATKE